MKKVDLKLSFEFFPAKNSAAEEQAWDSLKKLENFNPEFFSVTFGAGGGERLKSDSFVKKIGKDSLVPVAGHLTCVDMSKEEINDLALGWFEKGINKNTSHYFFGNKEEVVSKIIIKLKRDYPNIVIDGYTCPPMLEVDQLVSEYGNLLSNLDSKVVWISLGLPKQELFMKQIKDSYNLTNNLIGIGGVFDWVSGTKMKAPEWAANLGLEWILRLVQEPRRLAKRYFVDNFLFIVYFIKQLTNKSKTL